MPSKRETILEALKEALEKITVANGYASTVEIVSRRFQHYSETTEFPALYIVTGPSELRDIDGQRHINRMEFTPGIVGYVKVGEDVGSAGILAQGLESLIADVMKAVIQDRHLGQNFVNYIVVESIDPYTDWDNNIGICEIILRIVYKFIDTEP